MGTTFLLSGVGLTSSSAAAQIRQMRQRYLMVTFCDKAVTNGIAVQVIRLFDEPGRDGKLMKPMPLCMDSVGLSWLTRASGQPPTNLEGMFIFGFNYGDVGEDNTSFE